MASADAPDRSPAQVAVIVGAIVALVLVVGFVATRGDDGGGGGPAAASPTTPEAAPVPMGTSPGEVTPSTPAGETATSPASTPSMLSWAVAGTGPDGRSIVVAVGPGEPCDLEPEYRVLSATASTIRLEVERVPSTCEVSTGATWPPKTVDVGRRVRGQSIEGEGRTDVSAALFGMPRLIGLRRADAEAILRNAQQPAPKVTGRRSGHVVAQDPEPGTPLFDAPAASLELGD